MRGARKQKILALCSMKERRSGRGIGRPTLEPLSVLALGRPTPSWASGLQAPAFDCDARPGGVAAVAGVRAQRSTCRLWSCRRDRQQDQPWNLYNTSSSSLLVAGPGNTAPPPQGPAQAGLFDNCPLEPGRVIRGSHSRWLSMGQGLFGVLWARFHASGSSATRASLQRGEFFLHPMDESVTLCTPDGEGRRGMYVTEVGPRRQ